MASKKVNFSLNVAEASDADLAAHAAALQRALAVLRAALARSDNPTEAEKKTLELVESCLQVATDEIDRRRTDTADAAELVASIFGPSASSRSKGRVSSPAPTGPAPKSRATKPKVEPGLVKTGRPTTSGTSRRATTSAARSPSPMEVDSGAGRVSKSSARVVSPLSLGTFNPKCERCDTRGLPCSRRPSADAIACLECNTARVACSFASRPKRHRSPSPDSRANKRSKSSGAATFADLDVLGERIVAGFASALGDLRKELRAIVGELRTLGERRVRFAAPTDDEDMSDSSEDSTSVVEAASPTGGASPAVTGNPDDPAAVLRAAGIETASPVNGGASFAALAASPAAPAAGDPDSNEEETTGRGASRK
ncbi:hypothetical protein AURDEDRAFT_176761 [Auricularia subglabra TFB-10046 SS5]|uniref:Zn(2)-C6 fungal-type domain-containing protein n=1 Tax=Auricularia subglabra (strain TFB-10046 / SS5) TaxID=717982 RepID=J0LCE8_AURST|nr:hypothetical protein AURDEDRAFT_176761 [Auricularia subglabra TFB-10046 SS5]